MTKEDPASLSRYVLLVEDDEALSEEVALALRENEVSVLTVTTSNDAIIKARNQRFSCIIMDLQLGKGSGEDVIEIIRQDIKSPNYKTPIIVTSANLNPSNIKKFKTNVQKIFSKPYSTMELNQAIDTLTNHQPITQESSQKSVLFVEDEIDLALEIVEEMEDSGVGVIHVTTADAAFMQTKKIKFDCIVVDINLSIGRGDELIERIRYDIFNLNKDSPIIVASSQLSKPLLDRISEKIQGGVVKPYSINDLFSKLKPYIPYI